MSVRVMSSVWEHSKASGSELLCLLSISDFADDDGIAWPSVKTLAHKTRLSERNIQYVLRKLQKLGELAIEVGAGPRGCNLYRVQPSAPGGAITVAPEPLVDPLVNIYGPFRNIRLTAEEHGKLLEKFTDTPERIEVMSEYIAATGKKYRSHYAALLTWARRAEKRQDFLFKEKSTPPRRTPNDGQQYLSLPGKPPDWSPLTKEESAEVLRKLRKGKNP